MLVAEREGDARGSFGNLLKDLKLGGKARRHSHLRCFVELRLAAAPSRKLRCLPRPWHTEWHTRSTARRTGRHDRRTCQPRPWARLAVLVFGAMLERTAHEPQTAGRPAASARMVPRHSRGRHGQDRSSARHPRPAEHDICLDGRWILTVPAAPISTSWNT